MHSSIFPYDNPYLFNDLFFEFTNDSFFIAGKIDTNNYWKETLQEFILDSAYVIATNNAFSSKENNCYRVGYSYTWERIWYTSKQETYAMIIPLKDYYWPNNIGYTNIIFMSIKNDTLTIRTDYGISTANRIFILIKEVD